jgi:hypothetical protein
MHRVVTCRNRMDRGRYQYTLTAPYGDVLIPGVFEPHFTPAEMLALGVFEGKYLNDCQDEFPVEWFETARRNQTLAPDRPDVRCNYFRVKSRQSLRVWREKGWLYGPDNRGWFQWYCRYYCGRRLAEVDRVQMQRWRSFKRHYGQVVRNCPSDDGADGVWCRPKQRQALLQWAYPCFTLGDGDAGENA